MADAMDAATCTKEQAQSEIIRLESDGDFLGARAYKQRLIELARPQLSKPDPKAAEELTAGIREVRECISDLEDAGKWAAAAAAKSELLRLMRRAGQ